MATSSSESALPRLIAKMEHAGVQPATVGMVVPTGYSFNLDGTAIYLTMASLFIADALGDPLSIGEQLGLPFDERTMLDEEPEEAPPAGRESAAAGH